MESTGEPGPASSHLECCPWTTPWICSPPVFLILGPVMKEQMIWTCSRGRGWKSLLGEKRKDGRENKVRFKGLGHSSGALWLRWEFVFPQVFNYHNGNNDSNVFLVQSGTRQIQSLFSVLEYKVIRRLKMKTEAWPKEAYFQKANGKSNECLGIAMSQAFL